MPPDAVPFPAETTSLSSRQLLEIEARRQGFAEVGVTDLAPFDQAAERARRALAEGRLDGMPWYTEERVSQSANLGQRFPWGRSLVALSFPYQPAAAPLGDLPDPPSTSGRPRGRVAGYALGEDYHLRMDRAIAERAGLGFCGKHTQLITGRGGSYVLLASLVLSLELAPDRPSKRNCGKCRACLPSCPTGALLAPGVIDAPRCISYLTIEHEGPIPKGLRPLMGTWVFGCDLCQEACPINARLSPAPVAAGPASTSHGPVPFPDLVELLSLSEASFQARFHSTTIRRSGRERLARNAAVALGNAGQRSAVPALARVLRGDPSALVRGACAWALGELGGEGAAAALASALAWEPDREVAGEIGDAVSRSAEPRGSAPHGLQIRPQSAVAGHRYPPGRGPRSELASGGQAD